MHLKSKLIRFSDRIQLQKPVSIIILTWNGLKYTKKCLNTLKTSINNYSPIIEVIVVDNGSTDDTVDYLKSLDWIKIITNHRNLGFSKGNNIGIKAANPVNDIILLNNDVEICQNDWILNLQNCAYKDNKMGIVGCRLLLPDRRLLHAGTYMPIETLWGQQIGGEEKDINQYALDREVEGIVFACAYIKRNIIQEVGLLDEDYFAYFEDTDYCFRVKEAGYKIFYCGNVNLIHHHNISTSINKLKHNDLFLESQNIFRQKWLNKLQNKQYFTEIGWHSLFNFENGYGITSREIALALDRHGVRVTYEYAYGKGTPFPLEEPSHSDSYMINIIRNRPFTKNGIGVTYAQGDVFKGNRGAYKIGFTMLETDRIPIEWVKQANMMDEIWTPSVFNKNTFRESGVTRPIYLIPLGVSIDYFNPNIRGYLLEDFFVFLSVFEWGERKAPELLLKAFNDEFNYKEDVILIVKTFNNDQSIDVYTQVKNLGLNPQGGKILISLNEIVPRYQLGALYKSANCFILPTRGEGWGMPMLEAMACGLPVIATNWGGQTEFMGPKNSFLLDVEKIVPAEAKCPYYQGFNWVEPSYEHLRYLMRFVYENRDVAKRIGEEAAADVAERWTWDHTAQRIIERIKSIQF